MKTNMHSLDHARRLMREERRETEDPERVIEQVGITKGLTVCDLACGPGYYTIPFSKAVGSDGTVFAIDKDSVMISELRKNLADKIPNGPNNVRIVERDVADTGIVDHSVDIVFFANVLHDLEDKESFLKEVSRLTRNQRSIIVDVDWHKREMENGPPYDWRLSESESRTIMKQNGLEIIHDINVGPNHYGLVARIKKI
jgi:ubiquinone/menaquinone biosynthesis C-methylase UbiE